MMERALKPSARAGPPGASAAASPSVRPAAPQLAKRPQRMSPPLRPPAHQQTSSSVGGIRALLRTGSGGGCELECTTHADAAYAAALELSRQQQYSAAREAFEALVRCHPHMCKAWVSYAQMEKRVGRLGDPQRLHIARYILQRGLSVNPDSACLAQAWGLLELQRGNWWAAVRLLERCVVMDAANAPVLRWSPVVSARQTVSSRRRGSAGAPAPPALASLDHP